MFFFFLHYTNLGRSSSSTGWKNTLEHAFDGLYDIKVYEGSVYYNGTSAVDVGDTVSQDALFINGSFTRFSERSDMDENLMPNTIPTDSLQTSSEIRPSEPNIDLPPVRQHASRPGCRLLSACDHLQSGPNGESHAAIS